MLKQFLPNRAAAEPHGGDLFAPHLDSFVADPRETGLCPARPCESACGCWATSHGGSDGKAWHSPICMSQLANQFLEERRRQGRLRQR